MQALLIFHEWAPYTYHVPLSIEKAGVLALMRH